MKSLTFCTETSCMLRRGCPVAFLLSPLCAFNVSAFLLRTCGEACDFWCDGRIIIVCFGRKHAGVNQCDVLRRVFATCAIRWWVSLQVSCRTVWPRSYCPFPQAFSLFFIQLHPNASTVASLATRINSSSSNGGLVLVLWTSFWTNLAEKFRFGNLLSLRPYLLVEACYYYQQAGNVLWRSSTWRAFLTPGQAVEQVEKMLVLSEFASLQVVRPHVQV